ncbi:hypothetical protein [Nonomuraea lactucae]|uniref:hypothetical protein n=1 Tax=Nonomuraea lactucae TaxID=2249762 RepID=UPI0013B4775B|nr:hypothetical protein [Nonomuraea lactucae]
MAGLTLKLVNAVIVGAIAGGLILIAGSVAIHIVRSIPEEPRIPAVDLSQQKGPMFADPFQACQKLSTSNVDCEAYHRSNKLINGETDAISVLICGLHGRIST